ncbi:MAG: UPF0182 family protein [Acidimicrobiales bacterium]|nr:UPF0182 family protein [Acidimicrobiales bacterium]
MRGPRFAGKARLIVGIGLLVAFFLLVSLPWLAGVYTDYLWFDSLDYSSVWNTVVRARVTLTLLGSLVFFLLCWGNLSIAERIAPAFRPSGADDDLIERYHDIVGDRAGLVRGAVALFLAAVTGASLGTNWNQWVLFTNRVDFGQRDATFKTDIGFYVFQLPFLTTVLSWLFSALILVLIVTLMSHVLNGGIRFHTNLDRVTPQVKAHVSVLLGALALVQGARYWLDRYQLTFSTRGAVDGATYTDVNVQLRVTYLLILISVFAFGLFIANIWRRGWVLPVMGVGLWMLVAVLAGVIVPAFVQRFRVEPSESTMEQPYIEHNIAATKKAYGLSDVETEAFDWKGDLKASDLSDHLDTLRNVRLWDPAIMASSFQKEQENRGLYNITDVDVDRYPIDDRSTEVMIAARDLAPNADEKSWENTHLAYTHGSGIVAAPANDKTSSGEPRIDSELAKLKESRIYFGKQQRSGYVIVNTGVDEIDAPGSDAASNRYDGADGIRMGDGVSGFLRKAAFAVRFGDINPLVSGSIDADSKVLLARDVSTRVKSLAPFLAFDHDPYVVVLDGRVKYVVDGYTTTRNYPNAQRADTGGLDVDSGLRNRSFNYARNSVKAVVDSYDGTVTMYVVDGTDPIIRAYTKAFPDLFTPVSKAPAELVQHFRYPEDLFTVQTQMWARYHVSNAKSLYDRNDEWRVPAEPGVRQVTAEAERDVGVDGQPISPDDLYQSQYVLMTLPGEDELSFVIMRPFAPGGRGATSQNQLSSFMVARSDPGHYGQLVSYVIPPGNQPDGPNLAADGIQSDDTIGDLRRSQCTGSSVCQFASPVLVPVGDSLLYVQSMFVAGTDVKAPQLQRVIVSYQSSTGTEVAVGTTLREALVQIFGNDVPEGIEDTRITSDAIDTEDSEPTKEPGSTGTTTPKGDEGGSTSSTVDTIIGKLVDASDRADAALKAGDPVAYAEQMKEVQALVKELEAARTGKDDDGNSGGKSSGGEGKGTTTSTTPTATTAPTRDASAPPTTIAADT